MRIKVIQTPSQSDVDGIDLSRFQVGFQYEVGNSLGAVFLAERWAVPVESEAPAILIPLTEFDADSPRENPPNLIREICPPYYDGPEFLTVDRRRRSRVSRRSTHR